jgi:hypothetical protein
MTTPIVNDNGINREMTADEAAAYHAWAEQQIALIEQAEQAAADKAAARAAVLAKLGLTTDEAAALLG